MPNSTSCYEKWVWKCIKITSILNNSFIIKCVSALCTRLCLCLCRYCGERHSEGNLHPCSSSLRLRSKELIFFTLATSVSVHLPVPWTEGSSHCLEETTQLSTVLPHAWQEDLRRAWQLLPGQEQVSAVSWWHRSLRRERKPHALFFVSFTFFFCLLEWSCKIFASFFGDDPSESSYRKCLLFSISNIIYT